MGLRLSRRAVVAGLISSVLPLRHGGAVTGARTPILDVHIHLAKGMRRRQGLFGAVDMALPLMDQFGIERAIVVPPPFPASNSGIYDLAELMSALRGRPRLTFSAGGGSLNPILQETPADRVSSSVLRRFTDAAEEIARSGAAAFGELAAEHFSSGMGQHPYESAPPDHPLMLALADIAAKNAMPIELHMEAVPQDMPFPPERRRGVNPEMLHANIAGLERLLKHNPQARIVWIHAGWDLSGERTVPLMRGLLERHENLAMTLKYDHGGSRRTTPFFPDGDALRPGWLKLIGDYSDRFMIGSDQFLDEGTERFEGARRVVDALPPELAARAASENAKRLYRLPAL